MNKKEKTIFKIPVGKGKIVKAVPSVLEIDKIFFDEYNPRIALSRDSQLLGTDKDHLSQKEVAFALMAQPAYYQLKKSIHEAGGVMSAIWVYRQKANRYIVIEGNTRLLVMKKLFEDEKDPKYKKINCYVLPCEIEEEVKDFVKLTSHLHGHTDWDAYEKAKYLYLLYEVKKHPLKELAKKTKQSELDISKDIEAYKIMSTQFFKIYGDEPDYVQKFSYFKEFVKDKKLQFVMGEEKLSSKNFCNWVAKNKFNKAQDVRRLGEILSNNSSKNEFLQKDIDHALEKLKDILPEKAEKFFILISDLLERINKLEFGEIKDFRKNKRKLKLVRNLRDELTNIIEDKK